MRGPGAVTPDAIVERHARTLSSAAAASYERLGAVNALNTRFAECTSLEHVRVLVRQACSQSLVEALVQMLVEAERMVAIAVQLLHWLALDAAGRRLIAGCGALPVLVAMMRAGDDGVREQGLRLLSVLAERRELALELNRAGVPSLLCSIAPSGDADAWHWILSIAAGVLCSPTAVRPAQAKALGGALAAAAERVAAGRLALAAADSVLLRRLIGELHVLTTMVQRVSRGANGGESKAKPRGAGSTEYFRALITPVRCRSVNIDTEQHVLPYEL